VLTNGGDRRRWPDFEEGRPVGGAQVSQITGDLGIEELE
jgi:hypothetical protein